MALVGIPARGFLDGTLFIAIHGSDVFYFLIS